jgi:hypothetical protein
MGKIRYILFVVALNRHEQTTSVFDAVRGQLFKQFAFFPAFFCDSWIGGDIACPAVQKSVISTGGTGVYVPFFN